MPGESPIVVAERELVEDPRLTPAHLRQDVKEQLGVHEGLEVVRHGDSFLVAVEKSREDAANGGAGEAGQPRVGVGLGELRGEALDARSLIRRSLT